MIKFLSLFILLVAFSTSTANEKTVPLPKEDIISDLRKENTAILENIEYKTKYPFNEYINRMDSKDSSLVVNP